MSNVTNKKILLPVDFSPNTVKSCDYALEIACKTGSVVTLFHSFFDQVYFSDGGFSTGFESGILLTDELILDFYKKKEERLKELAAEYTGIMAKKGFPGLSFNFIIESGDPQVNILQCAKSMNAGLIIMGSTGLGKKAHLAGSVCERIINHSSIPVLAVPESISYTDIEHVLYMTDFEEGDTTALAGIRNLFGQATKKIYCLHLDIGGNGKENDEQMLSLSRKAHQSITPGEISFHVIDCRQPVETINEFVQQNKIGLISFIPHRRGFFRSLIRQDLTKKDLFLTNIPILAMPC